ncbi:hypothetical protein CGZ98_03830 [Enemella evansiae]|uniref:hypothetical protein n=1 Tax=Enemella evansiae TaxID=2016499 RepID=UPI000B96F542|nr:hypothetical protein [Enemella evansiae]OYO15547.1 hypothetical protein CGZ98_03830 [Enemella evansiae]
MRPLPRFWAVREDIVRGPDARDQLIRMWGWSTDSLADATRVAGERVARLAETWRLGRRWDEYYPRIPLREEVLGDLTTGDGTLVGVVTRIRYGAEVLNTDALLIADLDLPADTGWTFWRGLFGRGPDPAAVAAAEEPIRARVAALVARRPDWGIHLYRTAAGFRLLVTGSGAEPAGPVAAAVLAELGSDEVYARLCASHQTYRARLTPKPWRAEKKLGALVRWPPGDPKRERRYRDWIARYDRAAAAYATCRLEERRGPGPATEAEWLLLTTHDRVTRAESGLPLA